MLEYEGSHTPEQKLNLPPEWYFDDESISEIYEKIANGEIPKDETRKLLHEVQSEFQNLDSRTDKTRQEEDKMVILNNIANQLVIEVGFDQSRDNPKAETPQDIEGVH